LTGTCDGAEDGEAKHGARKPRRRSRIEAIAAAIGEATPDAIICTDARGRIIYWNPGAERMFGHSSRQAVGEPIEIIIPEALRGAHGAGLARLVEGGDPSRVGKLIELPAVHRDGTPLDIELSLAAWNGSNGKPAGFGATIRDLSHRKALEREQEEQQRFLDSVIDNLPAMLFVKDAETLEYRLWNNRAEAATGIARADVIGRTDEERFPSLAEGHRRRDLEALAAGQPMEFESRFVREDSGERVFCTRRVPFADADGRAKYILGVVEDRTEAREAQERLAFLAGHDPLTGLPNRATFTERVEEAVRRGRETAILTLNIERFKTVNDMHGHQIGDQLLVAVAALLHEVEDVPGSAARCAGDEFALLVTGNAAAARAGRKARMIGEALAEPIAAADKLLRIEASMGVAAAAGATAKELIANADLALERARQSGRGQICYFESDMDRAARQRRRLEALLRDAIGGPEIGIFYQPIACLRTGRVVGFEALARWHSAEEGQISPDVFIPIAEDSGLIVALGRQVLRMAAAEAAQWQPDLKIAVNLSPIQVQDQGLYGMVAATLAQTGLDPRRLELEVTEGVLIRDSEAAIAVLRRLKALGIGIAMDDFGTGYSSLGYLRRFPFDKVKIDQSFVREMGSSPEALAIVQAVIGLSRGLGLPVVAEGVETTEQLEALHGEGCDMVQGYLIGRPAPIAAFERVVIDRAWSKKAAKRTRKAAAA
jgi:diguanylate cyclase (GGDEF)-like protein/PAS domain S-box-containing protein